MNPRIPLSVVPRPPAGANKGLLLDKFIPVKTKGEKGDNASYYDTLHAFASVDSAYPAYRLAYERWALWAKSLPHAVRFQGRVRGRLALGLGIESVTEIGCRLHHTYGVPVIPASSLKGALRAAMASASGGEEWQARVKFLFGSEESRGYAAVSDAWWIPEAGKSGLAPDVLTSHHTAYYTGAADAAPTDFDSPVPNHFLTITGRFAFTVQAPNESWQRFLEELVRRVLSVEGIGAKRSSGYGRLEQLSVW